MPIYSNPDQFTTQVGFHGFWPSYGKLGGSEAPGASQSVGKDVITGTQDITVDSFLTDRPPAVIEPEEEVAEVRWGQKSNFQYDNSTGRYAEEDDYYVQADYSAEGFDGFDLESSFEQEALDGEPVPTDDVLVYDVQEVNRQTETIRVTIEGSNQTGYVDIARIKSVTFQMPDRVGPTGSIRVFYTFHMNWGDRT
jgi:hypothetical protein